MPGHALAEGCVLFAPGYRATPTMMRRPAWRRRHRPFLKALKQNVGRRVCILSWHSPVVAEMADQLVERYFEERERDPLVPIYFVGFSMGSVAAVMAAQRLEALRQDHNLAGLMLASLTPAFDWPFQLMVSRAVDPGDDWIALGVEQFSGLRGEPLPLLHKPVHLYVGEGELPVLRQMAWLAHARWRGFSRLREVPGVKHSIDNPSYVEAVARLIPAMVHEESVPPAGWDFDDAELDWHKIGPAKVAATRRGGVVLEHPSGKRMVVTLQAWYCMAKSMRAGRFPFARFAG